MATNFGLSSDSEDSDEDMRVIIGQRQICTNRPDIVVGGRGIVYGRGRGGGCRGDAAGGINRSGGSSAVGSN